MGVDTDKIATIYNGVDGRLFFPQEKNDARKKISIPLEQRVMLFVGNLEMVKGSDILIDAYNKIKLDKSNREFKLISENS